MAPGGSEHVLKGDRLEVLCSNPVPSEESCKKRSCEERGQEEEEEEEEEEEATSSFRQGNDTRSQQPPHGLWKKRK
ncbi:hypothetical protein ACOMHN_052219 [Nucella lapillus]